MVGNLLDNAFEAAKQAENGKIEFSLYTIDGKSCVVSVINTALTAPKCENETLVSAKPDAQSHGYGIKVLKRQLRNTAAAIRGSMMIKTGNFTLWLYSRYRLQAVKVISFTHCFD